jgi:hypothetical protein
VPHRVVVDDVVLEQDLVLRVVDRGEPRRIVFRGVLQSRTEFPSMGIEPAARANARSARPESDPTSSLASDFNECLARAVEDKRAPERAAERTLSVDAMSAMSCPGSNRAGALIFGHREARAQWLANG